MESRFMTSQWTVLASAGAPQKRENGIMSNQKMLKQVRHISEGNFYGLRVTNKAQKLSLDREIRTLETWKDVQSHVFRKEEKELMSTLKRLEHSKHDHHHEDHDYPEKCSSSHHRRPSSFHSKHQLNSDKQEHFARKPSERGQRKILVNVGTEISDAQSSSKVPCRVRVLTDTSDVNVIISLTPEASSVATAATRQSDVASFPPLVERHKGDTGAEVHRTRGFMSCVICNLPRYNHGKEITNACSCPPHPSKHSLHVHHGHQASEKLKKLHTDDDNLKTHLAKRQKRVGTGDHFSPQPHLTRKQVSYQPDNTYYARSRTSSKEEDNKSHSPGSHRRIYKHNTTESEHRLHDRERRSRESSFGESKSWRSSLEESNRSLWSNYIEGRSRESSFGDNDNRSLKRRHGSRHRKHGHEEELYNLYKRLKRLFPSLWEDYHASKEDEEPKPVFSGLMHPDNIINHHHFLPYEAHQQDKEIPKPNKHHSAHDQFHPTSSHLVGIRKESQEMQPSLSHIVNAFEHNHEPSITHSMLFKLKQLLHAYHSKEDHVHRYPWPRPPPIKFTTEEFKKLFNCRYLRLTKTNLESLQQLLDAEQQ